MTFAEAWTIPAARNMFLFGLMFGFVLGVHLARRWRGTWRLHGRGGAR